MTRTLMLLAVLAVAMPAGAQELPGFPPMPQAGVLPPPVKKRRPPPPTDFDEDDDDIGEITLPGVPRLRRAPALPGMMGMPQMPGMQPRPVAQPPAPAPAAPSPASPAQPTMAKPPATPPSPPSPPRSPAANVPVQGTTTTIYGRDEDGNLTVPLGTVTQGRGSSSTVNGQPVPPPRP